MTSARRCILHLDLDAFYAAVEQRDHPQLQGRPVIVGGSLRRGVVCAASYEARYYGVRSAMPMAQALRLCPEAVVQPVRMAEYRAASRAVFAIFARYTDCIEALSIDEAFLDVSHSLRLFGPGAAIAGKIRQEVRDETGLTLSAGIAPNKFLAKLASEAAKPDGLREIHPDQIDAFLLPLPVRSLWGVGAVTAERLAAMGIRQVGELRRLSRDFLHRRFGTAGGLLYELARGIDERPVDSEARIKSIGHEDTYAEDLRDTEVMRRELLALSERVAGRLRRKGVQGRCVTVKVKFADFSVVTRSRTLSTGLSNGGEIFSVACELLGQTEAGRRPVRLLGVSLSTLEALGAGQPELFSAPRHERLLRLDRAVDALRERFGDPGVVKAGLLAHPPSASDVEE
ncbi:DNA polymerase IV [Geoalkalibacter halelectricus]|uniref:DNA polymerase IV n=1 Tax=Geoalkalibacter halelectricus TaxID=2847045 RepID=A0ABY5ZQP3_9BACT|nr:DNA polymerase IV [Geoalkalibacter halelectricus]MDO3378465.1 DNA polymerase IV [Geoalkalibacter halelectricus]UWZ80215.1 DNA polymerase IV [Geoalkalibacter halelectricus]